MEKLILPKKDKETGEYFVSYSQCSAWNEAKGFSTGLLGRTEYIRKYFFNEKFPDELGFAQFGSEVEAAICLGENLDAFDDTEKAVLKKVKPLGVFQKKFKLQFDGFYVLGFMDDLTPDLTHIRDYKTCSRKSGEKYTKPEYEQLCVYAAAIEQETGKLPTKLEVLCIGRSGNPFRGGGRSVLRVEDDIWSVDRSQDLDPKRIEAIKQKIVTTAHEISEYYQIFLHLNKI